MITVKSWDELLKYGTDIALQRLQYDKLKVKDDLVFHIKISGPSWGGYIDYRGAQYILQLQKTVNGVYRELVGDDIPPQELKKYIRVRVKVSEGCSLFEVNLNDAIMKMVNNMSSGQATLIIVLIVLCVAGYLSLSRVLDYKRKITEELLKNETTTKIIDKFTSTVDNALKVIDKANAERPSRTLINRLEEEDKIVLPNTDELSVTQVKNLYPRKPKTKPESDIFDGEYHLQSIDFDKAPPAFTLEKDGFTFTARAELASGDIEKLAQNLEAALKEGTEVKIDLQVFINYTKRDIKTASITGIGERRPKSKDVGELITLFNQD